ncbi:ketoacyl-ACP synthase III [Streptomyces sp. YC504]|uniref:Ketoacyl-ACP synthase III n=1 Tax=Streptomyces mesophilus TaxID=1775132 RepID=A0A6G4XAD3_9ACTN|nr:ketoacyl-ACP synthase III [Streptomyces mesophilus]NGO74112.1 ketoacyl-ACP synthase III [Streptomyces mesophilus]
MPTRPIGILGTGSYVPRSNITNAELAARVGVDEEWIHRQTRITGRRYAADDEATSDLATHAARTALDRAGIDAGRLDHLIVATSTPDSPQPPTAHRVQHALGAQGAACFDINAACSGFVYGLALARSLVAQRRDSRILVVAADVCSRFLDFSDRRTAVLMGDGAGAVVVGPVEEGHGFLDFELAGRGHAARLIRVDAGGSRLPASARTVEAGAHFLRMDGRGVVEFLLREFPPFIDALLRRAGVTADQVDHFVPHQPNGVLLSRLVERAGLTKARTHRTVEEYGNTGAASVPLTLDIAHRTRELRHGDLVLLAGFGSGMSLGASLMRWTEVS